MGLLALALVGMLAQVAGEVAADQVSSFSMVHGVALQDLLNARQVVKVGVHLRRVVDVEVESTLVQGHLFLGSLTRWLRAAQQLVASDDVQDEDGQRGQDDRSR